MLIGEVHCVDTVTIGIRVKLLALDIGGCVAKVWCVILFPQGAREVAIYITSA